MLVTSNAIVETLDVIKDVRLGLSPFLVDLPLDSLALQITKERFSHCVVPAIATATHTWV
jgi:hypothetical protein